MEAIGIETWHKSLSSRKQILSPMPPKNTGETTRSKAAVEEAVHATVCHLHIASSMHAGI